MMDFAYVEKSNEIEITGYLGKDADVTVPTLIDGKPVTRIAAKAFLSQTGIEKLTLPATISLVDDWAFCHMKNLRRLTLGAIPAFGRQVWKGCLLVEEVELVGIVQEGFSNLLAASISFWNDSFFVLQGAVNRQNMQEWYLAFDETLSIYLHKADDVGFVPGFVGWFDDGDVDVERENYCNSKRVEKLKLLLMRLRYDFGLRKEDQKQYVEYLFRAKPGDLMTLLCGTMCSHDVEYMKVFERIGGLKRVDAGTLLDRLDSPDPEVSAFLLSVTEADGDAFFDSLNL